MSTATGLLTVHDHQTHRVVAQVVLNGYDIRAGVCAVPHGAMRSFRVVEGDLWNYWNLQSPLILSNSRGQEARVKVAAMPVDDDGFGLIEFL